MGKEEKPEVRAWGRRRQYLQKKNCCHLKKVQMERARRIIRLILRARERGKKREKRKRIPFTANGFVTVMMPWDLEVSSLGKGEQERQSEKFRDHIQNQKKTINAGPRNGDKMGGGGRNTVSNPTKRREKENNDPSH